MFTVFSKKKSNKLQPNLEEALRLVQKTTFLASPPYFCEAGYQFTETEIQLLQRLQEAYQQAYTYIGYVSRDWQQRAEPVLPCKGGVIRCYTSP